MDSFDYGVASGDPTATSVLLWTRIAAREGGSSGSPPSVRAEVAEAGPGASSGHRSDAPFGPIEATVVCRPDEHGFVRCTVGGLRPGQRYSYRFTTGRSHSPIGITAPLPVSIERFRIGLACCARLPSGGFDVYRDLARTSPDLVIHLGDYIYEDGDGGARGPHEPAAECRTEHDYRLRYAQYRRDPDLGAAHAAAPWVAVWDDHEVANDGWRWGSASESGRRWQDRLQAARAAHGDWLPQRAKGNGPTPLDRHLRIGDLADVIVVDTRYGGREQPAELAGPTVVTGREDDARPRDILSEDQWTWLETLVNGSTASWILLVTSVQLAPLQLARLPTPTWPPSMAPLVNPDQWDGYPAARRRLHRILAGRGRERDPPGIVALSGDLHARFVVANTTRRVLCEVTTPSVSAPPFADLIRRRLRVPEPALRAWLRLLNPHFDHVDLQHHGGTTLDIDSGAITVAAIGGAATAVWRLTREAASPAHLLSN